MESVGTGNELGYGNLGFLRHSRNVGNNYQVIFQQIGKINQIEGCRIMEILFIYHKIKIKIKKKS